MARLKRDKWKEILDSTQRQAEARIREVKQLLEAQERLMHKEAVMQQIIKGLSLLAELMAASAEHLSAAGNDTRLLDQVLDTLMQLELQIQMAVVSSPGAACCSSSQASGNAALLRCVFDPAEQKKVQQMTDEEIIARLRALAGKCAIMLLQDKSQAALWQPSAMNLGTDAVQAAQQQATEQQQQPKKKKKQPSTANSTDTTLRQQQQQQPAAPSRTGSGSITTGSLPSTVTAGMQRQPSTAAGSAAAPAGGSSGGEQQQHSPEFEYNALAAGLLLSDTQRFMKIGFVCLEDATAPMPVLPQDFWRSVARKLQLTAQQIATLKSLRDLVHSAMSGAFADLSSSTRQQAELIQQHQSRLQQHQSWLQQQPQQLQQQQQQPQQQENKKHAMGQAAGQGQAGAAGSSGGQVSVGEHEETLKRQDASLKQWYLLWLWMGIVTANTLTPRQMATLVSGSYPSIVRIDPILQFLDELEPHQPPEQSMQQLRLA